MSIEQLNNLPQQEEVEQNERAYYKQRADEMGISYPNNIPTDKLKELVKAKLEAPSSSSTYAKKLPKDVQNMRDEAEKLVRFKINVLDPTLANWTGMYVTVGNDNLTPIRRAIYFIDQPWHAEKIIVDALKQMQYAYRPSSFNSKLRDNFNKYDKPKMLPRFHIEILPPLTQEELKDLAVLQAQNNTGQRED